MTLLIILNIWLMCRLAFIEHETPLPNRLLIGVILIVVLAGGLLSFSWGMLGVVSLLVLSLMASERWLPEVHLNLWRLLMVLLVLLALGLARPHFPTDAWIPGLLDMDRVAVGRIVTALWVLMGLLLLANEVNLLIRALFHHFQLEPTQAAEQNAADATEEASAEKRIDQREYNAGRIIGILERWLMYSVIVVSHNYNVIAFILAAKGFARFRQLEERAFAEYVLIGTLASTLFTVAVSEGILFLKSL
ncbi:MAG: hypothetical protein LAT65_05345 [Saccharospirillum sp.]|nr:hypothetical protein [Saccharospirillum sp.]